jgi:nitroreductase
MHAQHSRNYEFFGAPVGLMFTIDRIMRQGSWLDFGMFLQGVMVTARGLGLDTCPQAAWTPFHRIIMPAIGAPANEQLGLRHVARLARPGRDREHAGHRARAGGELRQVTSSERRR